MATDPPAPFHPTATRRVRNTVRVGVGVVVLSSDNRIWAGIRQGSHGAGQLALPGGHLELQESWQDCANREVWEEMHLEMTQLHFLHVTNDPMPQENKHYVTIFMMGRADSDSPQNMEPDKCKGWNRYTWEELQNFAENADSEYTLFGPLLKLAKENPPRLQAFVSGQDIGEETLLSSAPTVSSLSTADNAAPWKPPARPSSPGSPRERKDTDTPRVSVDP